MPEAPRTRRPWTFVPGLYVLQGMPYFAVQAASNTFLAAMGAAPSVVGRWSSDLTLPWMLKPLWSPFVDLHGTKRRWLFASAAVVFLAFAALACAAPATRWLEWTLGACVALALASATYDVACDGYYMLALGKREQETYVGIRNACYRLGRILVAGGVVTLAGLLQGEPGSQLLARGLQRGPAWGVAFAAGAALYGAGVLVLWFLAPAPSADGPGRGAGGRAHVGEILRAYVARPRWAAILAFVLLYRFGESVLTPMLPPFLLGARAAGGLGLGEAQVGQIYGTAGVVALLSGGIAGGWLVARVGLWRCLWPMALAMNVPNLLYVWAAHARPGPLGAALVVGIEQLGYGFGFSAYMVYLLQLARGSRFATTHYAISTGLMGLSAWVAGRWSGVLVEWLGFADFFWLVCALGLPGLVVLAWLPRLEDAGEGPG
ncbi:MAG: MFS transporter [Planctomycetes bacterium]|nr:MFS transporter [Planctomycetota bacterium]